MTGMLGLRRSRGGKPSPVVDTTSVRCSHPTVVFYMCGFDAIDNDMIEGYWHCEYCGRRFVPEPEAVIAEAGVG